MEHSVAQLILQDRKIGYLITDTKLRVVEIHGDFELLMKIHVRVGASLLEEFPELIGSEELLASVLSGASRRFELTWVNRETDERETMYLNMTDLPRRDDAGQICGLVHVIEDDSAFVTLEQQLAQRHNELRLLQDKLAQQNKELELANVELKQLDQARSMFVSIAAHELRTPLTPINGYMEMLLLDEMGSLNEKQRRALQTVHTSTMRLVAITSELLDVSRIDAGRIELTLIPVDTRLIIRGVVDQFQPQLDAKSQQLNIAVAPNLPLALCDQSRVEQIIGNLLSNASKYTPEHGHITIEATPAAEEGFIQVSVIDNGAGIPHEEQAQLFKQFSRTQNARTSGASGVGLGLYITKSLVELHTGRIWVDSKPGTGSSFHITLPIGATVNDNPATASL